MYALKKLRQLSPARKIVDFEPFNFRHFLAIILIISFSRIFAWIAYLIGARIKTHAEYSNFPLISNENIDRIINSATFYGDFAWYLSTATDGYAVKPFVATVQTNWAFFPLQGWLSLMIESPINRFGAGIICFTTGLVLMHRVASRFMDEKLTIFAILLIAFWPGSYVLSQFRPEALLFTFSVMSIYFAMRRVYIAALLALLLASFAKPNGFLLLLVLLPIFLDLDEIQQQTKYKPFEWFRIGAMVLAGIAGPLYMTLVSQQTSGNAFAWIKIQIAWGAAADRPWNQIIQLLTDPMIIGRWGWDFEFFNWIVFILGIIAIRILIQKRQYIFAVYTGLYGLMTFLNFGNWVFIRHTATCIPLFVGLAQIGNENVRQVLVAVCALMFGVLMTVAGSGYIPGLF